MGAGMDDVAALYRRFGPAVHRRASSLLRDEEEAYDVTQETFLAFLRQRGSLRGEAAPFTVLYQMATFKAVDRLRSRARWTGRMAELGAPPEDDEGTHEAPHRGEDRLARVEAAQDLSLLTRGEKPEVLTAALLYYVEGHTTEEVAQTLDLSRKTVGKMLAQFVQRARKRQARLDPGGEG